MDFHPLFLHTGSDNAVFVAAVRHAAQRLAEVLHRAEGPYSGLNPDRLWEAIRTTTARAAGNRSLEQATDLACEQIVRHAIIVQHPHCIAHLHTPPLVAGVIAELLIGALNQSMDSWDQASSATFTEIEIVRRVASWFDLPPEASGVFTGGATQSNFMGLLVARDAVCQRVLGCDVRREGLPADARRLRVLCSETSHFSTTKAVTQLGLGERAVCLIRATAEGQIDMAALEGTLQQMTADSLIPMAIVGTAGTTDHGAIDPLRQLADVAQKHGAWLHVDAAFGSGLILSSAKHRLAGIEQVDSLSVDFHKFFYQPISCGVFLLRDGRRFGHIEHHADYLNRVDDPFPNLVDRSIATSRRFDALKVWLTLQCIPEATLGAMVDRTVTLAGNFADRITGDPVFELLAKPQLSTVLFRYSGSDEFNRKLRLRLLTDGHVVLGETVIAGRVALKLTVLNPCLTDEDGARLLEAIRRTASALHAEKG